MIRALAWTACLLGSLASSGFTHGVGGLASRKRHSSQDLARALGMFFVLDLEARECVSERR